MSDNYELRSYADAMARGLPFIHLKLDVDQPVELSEFVASFTALASEYSRYVRRIDPGANPEATLYVREVRSGSIEADLVPWLTEMATLTLGAMGGANLIADFVNNYGDFIRSYLPSGKRRENVTKTELKEIGEQVAAIASIPDSKIEVAAIEVIDGERQVRAMFKFNTSEAVAIQAGTEAHKRELDQTARADWSRVLMIFTRSDVRAVAPGRRSGDQVIIEAISNKPLPVVYASDLAGRAIKYEIAQTPDNVHRKGFQVDVNVETRNGKPVAYSVTDLHSIIDLPDEDDD